MARRPGTPTRFSSLSGYKGPLCIWYEAESGTNTLAGSATTQICPTCSGGYDVGYVGNNDGALQFNGVAVGTTGVTVTIAYANGDAVRYALLSVNGNPGTPLQLSVHRLISDCWVYPDDCHLEFRQQQHA